MKFELIAQMIDGAREELSQSEFIGDGIENIYDAISTAKKALEYLNGEQLIARYIDIYCDGNIAVSNGYCGYVDDAGWHCDCDCDLG